MCRTSRSSRCGWRNGSMRSAEHASMDQVTRHAGGGDAMSAKKRVSNVKVSESLQDAGARAVATLKDIQRGEPTPSYVGVSFGEIGQMLAAFTPRRWELIPMLREAGPSSTSSTGSLHHATRRPTAWSSASTDESAGLSRKRGSPQPQSWRRLSSSTSRPTTTASLSAPCITEPRFKPSRPGKTRSPNCSSNGFMNRRDLTVRQSRFHLCALLAVR